MLRPSSARLIARRDENRRKRIGAQRDLALMQMLAGTGKRR